MEIEREEAMIHPMNHGFRSDSRTPHYYYTLACVLQLRVIRAFKSTLEDLEERRSVHSLHSMRSSRSHPGPRPLSDITYIDEDPVKTPNTLAVPGAKMVTPADDPHRPLNSEGHSPKHFSNMSHETSI
ncbi:hypothetical protein J6590_008601 [Homalodisca vitripennis]|nr:hypothetical protein J6590_008601 [Homalodisca vitripennis]